MASALSVVGQNQGPQHRLDSEPQLNFFKFVNVRKKMPRKYSLEKIISRKCSGTGELGPVTPEGGRGSATAAAASPAGGEEEESARGARSPGSGGCADPFADAPPRSAADLDPDPEEQRTVYCDGGAGPEIRSTAPASPENQRARRTGGDHPDQDCDLSPNARNQKGNSHMKTTEAVNVTPGALTANGHHYHHHNNHHNNNNNRGARSDAPHGKRASPCGGTISSISTTITMGSSDREALGRRLPLERLTQGRTGVVRLARTEPPRREAWSIFSPGEVRQGRQGDPRVKAERGEGHRFTSRTVTRDWCDVCGCQLTARAALKCQKPSDLGSDGSYTGFIKVHLRLSRPVTVTAMEDAVASEGGVGQADRPSRLPAAAAAAEGQAETNAGQGAENRTSFYLPSNYVMHFHISSTTMAREVIQGLLKKYMVLDNPRKFALYQQTHRDGQDLFQKLPLCEYPLLLRLLAGPDPNQLSFVLKENETGEVEWHAFSVPELQNFLVILEKEEGERVRTVEQRYSIYRQKLQQALRQHDP
ncbi:unnamed protein product [Merluccius merluccius]